MTIGSRGDVQPYIALCKRLLAEGHRPKIATHREFRSWIERHGIEFAPVEGDPAELMRLCVENGVMTFSFLKEAGSKVSSFDLFLVALKLTEDSFEVGLTNFYIPLGKHVKSAIS